jgi:hypothetical protein
MFARGTLDQITTYLLFTVFIMWTDFEIVLFIMETTEEFTFNRVA